MSETTAVVAPAKSKRGGRGGRGRGRGALNNTGDREIQPDQTQSTSTQKNKRKRGGQDDDDDDDDDFFTSTKKQCSDGKNDTDRDTPKQVDCDVFIGEFKYLTELKHWFKVRDYVCKYPNEAHFFPSDKSVFPQDDIGKNRKCRILVLSINPLHYNQTSGTALFTDKFDVKARTTKFEEILTRISNEIAAAKTFYSPSEVFIEIIQRFENDCSEFNAILYYICAKYGYEAMKIDKKHKKSVFQQELKNQAESYVKSLKYCIRSAHPPANANIEISKLPANKGINLNDM